MDSKAALSVPESRQLGALLIGTIVIFAGFALYILGLMVRTFSITYAIFNPRHAVYVDGCIYVTICVIAIAVVPISFHRTLDNDFAAGRPIADGIIWARLKAAALGWASFVGLLASYLLFFRD